MTHEYEMRALGATAVTARVLEFSERVEMLKLAAVRLRGAGVESVMLHGGIPPEKRLRLARVVLDAGFAGDAVRASYEALFHAVAALLEGDAPATHAALVAAIYRDLTPRGRGPAGLHPVLARLYDLTTLEGHGVEVDEALAREAVADAEAWVTRLVR